MKLKKIEEKIIESIDVNDVPSLETIKSRMDFSKKPFKEKEVKENTYKRKMVFGCLISSLCTLIICLVCMFVIINDSLGKSANAEDVLSKEEMGLIMRDYDDVMSKPAFHAKLEKEYEVYIYECYDNVKDKKAYYFKAIYRRDKKTFYIHIEEEIKTVSFDNNFGLLLSMDYNLNNQKIEFEIEIDGVKKYYCFTN